MSVPSPGPLTTAERRSRRSRVARIAQNLGFVGRVEYRHIFSQTGGAQYGRGSTPKEDLLTVYAEAFDREGNPGDFSHREPCTRARSPIVGTPFAYCQTCCRLIRSE